MYGQQLVEFFGVVGQGLCLCGVESQCGVVYLDDECCDCGCQFCQYYVVVVDLYDGVFW